MSDGDQSRAKLYAVPEKGAGRRISPTVVSQFVRLEQCRRYLRLALHERAAGPRFMYDYHVAPQAILPLLTRSGSEFERRVETAAGAVAQVRNFALERQDGGRDANNGALVAAAQQLPAGESLILFQARLQVPFAGWDMTGDADIVRLERDGGGLLDVLVADMKATRTAKIEHRLQVAFYREMLERLFTDAGIAHRDVATAILYRGTAASARVDAAEAERFEREREAAQRLFGVDDAQLELTPDPDAFRDVVRSLVTGPDSVAREVATAHFADIPWHLNYKCDGCLYNEFCMRWAAEHDDLSLLPHLTEQDKRGLAAAGVTTTRSLATLLMPTTDDASGKPDWQHLLPAPGREEVVSRIARTWPVGPRLEELVHRARRYRSRLGDALDSLPYIPSKGYGSLPYSDASQNPNLVRVFIDAQQDYLLDRTYLLGALVVGNEAGVPSAARRRALVEITDGPPDEDAERDLLLRWIDGTIRAVADVAAPDEEGNARAPIHLIFFNSFEQDLLLQALNRHARDILGATPLYDFITQLAAFDSTVVTFLDREIRELKNYPMVCQSLQAVASMARPFGERFDWNEPQPFREIFRERLFDALGKFYFATSDDGEHRPWATRRARFNSQIPLEYAYAAWGALSDAPMDGEDPYAPYRRATVSLLTAFQLRRLEALEHVANDFSGNKLTTKSAFAIPDLAQFDGKARGLAEALQEFVTIERHVDLAAWKSARLPSPERRVLAGDTLLVRYLEADQFPGVAETYRENRRRAALRQAQREEYLAANPGKATARYTPEQKALADPLPIEAPFRLRIEHEAAGISLDDVLGLTTIKSDEWVTIQPRWDVDSRLPPEEQTPYTPTPKQLLYGMRQAIVELEVETDAAGRAARAWLHTRPAHGPQSDDPPGFLFASHERELVDGELYTVDPNPNDNYGFNGAKVVQGLLAGKPNELFRRVSHGGSGSVTWPANAAAGQARFMEGLQALHRAGAFPDFEPSKVELIGEHGDTPLLLVQGPPGTGKSFTTAYAILARIQGAMAADLSFRVLMGAKTHAATDVLLEHLVRALDELARKRDELPAIFAEFFDERLLDIALYRLQPRGEILPRVTGLTSGTRRPREQTRALEIIAAKPYAVVASTPGGVYSADNDTRGKLFSNEIFELLVLDEASQLSLPESIMAALPLKRDGQVMVVGDHRQMAPIVKHDWASEARRTFQDYAVYRSLFDTIQGCEHQSIKFERSFRLDRDMAEFLRRSIYERDNLQYHSARTGRLRVNGDGDSDGFVASVLRPEHPIVVIVHDEAASQQRNDFERELTSPLLVAMQAAGYSVRDGFGMVVPHRAQRANLQQALRNLMPDANVRDEIAAAVDTVERFQGGERDAIVVSATESDPAYLLATGAFLFDPRRLTVAISRARDKMVLVASRSVFDVFSPDEETFNNAQLWKDLLYRTCTEPLWSGVRHGHAVEVWGNPPLVST